MTPDLFEQGSERLAAHQARVAPEVNSGDRSAGYGRVHEPGSLDVTHGRILYLEDVNVSFDGFKAINHLSLDIAPGELRCIIGPNGAGKTTMMDIITGKTKPDSGQVFFGSTIDLLRHNEPEIAQIGIGQGKRWYVGWKILKCNFDIETLRMSRRLGRGIGRSRGSMLILTLHCVAIRELANCA